MYSSRLTLQHEVLHCTHHSRVAVQMHIFRVSTLGALVRLKPQENGIAGEEIVCPKTANAVQ
jgi:hypothetical protein